MSVQVTIKALLQGVATDDVQRTQDAWRHLIRQGQPASAAISFILEQGNWTVPGTEAHARHLAMLLAALNEIEPRAAKRQAARMFNLNIDPVHRATIEHLSSRFADTPDRVTADGIEIYVSPQIASPQTAVDSVLSWLDTPSAPHLDTVSRISIAPDDRAFAYLEQYGMLFSDVCVTWPNATRGRLSRQINALLCERRFYNAISHKVYAHGQGGPVQRQQAEARRFANRMMRRAHPTLGVVGTPISALGALFRQPQPSFPTN